MKKFAFVSDAAEKEYKDLPDEIQDEFGKNLRIIQFEQEPVLPIKYLSSIGSGVIELIINGSPAFRCMYIAKYIDTVIVLHSFTKTTVTFRLILGGLLRPILPETSRPISLSSRF